MSTEDTLIGIENEGRREGVSPAEERIAHFADSARQVAFKILDLGIDTLAKYNRDDQKIIGEIIAKYAYDVAIHVIRENMSGTDRAIHYYVNTTQDIPGWLKIPEE